MISLPSRMLDEPKVIQLMQRPHEPRLYLEFERIFIFIFIAIVNLLDLLAWFSSSPFAALGWRCMLLLPLQVLPFLQIVPLRLEHRAERLEPIININHLATVQIASEQDTRVWMLPKGETDLAVFVVLCRLSIFMWEEQARNDGSTHGWVDKLHDRTLDS